METIVFTNGCYDIIHPGHIDLLKRARSLGTKLIVGINSDRSVREIKGAPRPFLNQDERTSVLRELRSVDEVRIFDENTPERLIREISPHVLVKGGDWQPGQIIGADFVIENGGKVFSIPFVQDISTSRIVEKIQAAGNGFAAPGTVNSENEKDIVQSLAPSIFKIFPASEFNNIERAKIIIQSALKNKFRIFFAGTLKSAKTVERMIEDFKESFESELICGRKLSVESERTLQPGDVLVVVAADAEAESLVGDLMAARRAKAETIVLTSAEGRKLAGLSDVCIWLETDSQREIAWRQTALGAYWSAAS